MLSHSHSDKWAAIVLTSVLVAALLLATFGKISRVERVQGWVVPAGGMLKVSAQYDGVVTKIFQPENTIVQQGAPLFMLRRSASLDGRDVAPILLVNKERQFDAQDVALRSEMEAAGLERGQLIGGIANLQRTIAESNEQRRIALGRLELARAQVQRAERLRETGMLTLTSLDQRRDAVFAAEAESSRVETALLEKQKDLDSARGQLQALPNRLVAIRSKIDELRARREAELIGLQTDATSVATASLSSRVAAIPVSVGQSVNAGATLAILTPDQSKLIAEVYIPSRAIGFIRPKQRVRLMYHAFPSQVYGSGSGTIETISKAVLSPADVRDGLKVDEPVFRARITLDRQTTGAGPVSAPLQPGMSLDAAIVLDKRSILKWIISPFVAPRSN